jgi:hypothetical protein
MKGDQNVIVEKNGSDFGKSLEFEVNKTIIIAALLKDFMLTNE